MGDAAGIPFPSLDFVVEPTPEDEIVDDWVETKRRHAALNFASAPVSDFSLDIDPIQRSTRQDKNGLLFRLLIFYDLSTLVRPGVLFGIVLLITGCVGIFGCCLFLPEFPVLTNQTLSHPGHLII